MNTTKFIGTKHEENLPTQSQTENNFSLEIILAICFHLIWKYFKRLRFRMDFSFRISDKNKKP